MRSSNQRVDEEVLAAGAELERQHVQLVYDAIARQWHGTRYKAWPRVVDFVRDLPPRSLVADLGCGNGKLAPSLRDAGHVAIGCDFSAELAVVGDCLFLPYRDGSFDAALSIAVLHHISSFHRRQRLVTETMRILRPGGRGLFYAWALEQHDGRSGHAFASRDVLVPFHRREQPGAPPTPVSGAAGGVYDPDKRATVFQRYCHVYTEGELRELLQSVAGCLIRDEYYDTGNWCALVEKDAGAPSTAGREQAVLAVEGGTAAPELESGKAVLESRCVGDPGGSSAHAGFDGAYTVAGGAGLDPQPWGRGVSTGPCAPTGVADTPAVCAAGAATALDGPVEVAVMAHLEEMLQQVHAIAGAADAIQREVQYDELAQMLERARLAGAK